MKFKILKNFKKNYGNLYKLKSVEGLKKIENIKHFLVKNYNIYLWK